MSAGDPIIPYVKTGGQSSCHAYIEALETRVIDLVEIRNYWQEEAKKKTPIVDTLAFESAMKTKEQIIHKLKEEVRLLMGDSEKLTIQIIKEEAAHKATFKAMEMALEVVK